MMSFGILYVHGKEGGGRGKGEIDEYVCMETGQRATRNYELIAINALFGAQPALSIVNFQCVR